MDNTKKIRRKSPWKMMLANDVVLCNITRQEPEEKQKIWRKVLEERGMKISEKKTECLRAGGVDAQDKGINL